MKKDLVKEYIVMHCDNTESIDVANFDTIEEAKEFIKNESNNYEQYNHSDNKPGCTHFWFEIIKNSTRTEENPIGLTIWGDETDSFYY